jgi:hypothetical protein
LSFIIADAAIGATTNAMAMRQAKSTTRGYFLDRARFYVAFTRTAIFTYQGVFSAFTGAALAPEKLLFPDFCDRRTL